MPGEQPVCHAPIDVGSSGVTRITLSLPLTAGVGGAGVGSRVVVGAGMLVVPLIGVGWAAPSDALMP
jgi:hypothetical protein